VTDKTINYNTFLNPNHCVVFKVSIGCLASALGNHLPLVDMNSKACSDLQLKQYLYGLCINMCYIWTLLSYSIFIDSLIQSLLTRLFNLLLLFHLLRQRFLTIEANYSPEIKLSLFLNKHHSYLLSIVRKYLLR